MERAILLVDRSPSTRRSLARRLLQIDCEILEADGLSQALELVGRSAFRVAILDLGSLAEKAPVLLGAIKRARPNAAVILLAGPEHIHISIQCMKLGAFEEVPVPLDVDRLLSTVTDALRRSDFEPGEEGGVPRDCEPEVGGGSPAARRGE